jgi:hypothetical protein
MEIRQIAGNFFRCGLGKYQSFCASRRNELFVGQAQAFPKGIRGPKL